MDEMYLYFFTNDGDFPFFIQYGFHDDDLSMHTHADFTELVIILNGTATHYVNDETYLIKKGDVFVINNKTAHGYKNTSSFRLCNIMYRPEKMLPMDLDICKSAGFHALFVIEPHRIKFHGFESRFTLAFDDFNKVNNLIAIMVDELKKKTDGWKTTLKAYFMLLVVLFSRAYSLSASNIKSNAINIAKSVSYIENHYTENISIDDLATQSNLSERHFSRIFKDTYKITPINYIHTLKMKHACNLLKNTSLNISQIAFQSGFNDSNYFSRQFRKFYNITPKEYRQKK